MNAEQRERLLGQIVSGVSPATACDDLGIDPRELLDEMAADRAFATSFYAALMQAGSLQLLAEENLGQE